MAGTIRMREMAFWILVSRGSVDCVSNAMEGYRKGNTTLYLDSLFQASRFVLRPTGRC